MGKQMVVPWGWSPNRQLSVQDEYGVLVVGSLSGELYFIDYIVGNSTSVYLNFKNKD